MSSWPGTSAPIVQVYHEKSFILPDVARVLACLYEKNVMFEVHTTSYRRLLRLQASSHAPVPFFDGPVFLEESRKICRYIAEKYEHRRNPFLGSDALERASIEQLLHYEEHAFDPPSRALFCHLTFPLDDDEDADYADKHYDYDDIELHARKLEEVLDVYEQRLDECKYLAGDIFTLADLVHLPNCHFIAQSSSGRFSYLLRSRKNVSRWWDAISSRGSWKMVLSYIERAKEEHKRERLLEQLQSLRRRRRAVAARRVSRDPWKHITAKSETTTQRDAAGASATTASTGGDDSGGRRRTIADAPPRLPPRSAELSSSIPSVRAYPQKK